MAYLKERVAQDEYNKALMTRHPLMNSAAANAAGQAVMWSGAHTNMAAINQAWPSNPGVLTANTSHPYETNHRVSQFQVEKVDNGFVLRSGSKAKVCKDMDELRDFFVSIMVEHQMDK
jgi:hypothetical protein